MSENEKKENVVEEEVVEEESNEVEKTEMDYLMEENEALIKELDQLKNDYAKAYADTENTRKRLNKEFEQQNKYKIQSFAKEILPILDNCERALAIETEDENYRKAFEMVYKQIQTAIEKEGVTEIEAEGEPFDPNWHQAMLSEHVEGVEPGMVLEVLQKGYKLKDRLLRAAMIKVSE